MFRVKTKSKVIKKVKVRKNKVQIEFELTKKRIKIVTEAHTRRGKNHKKRRKEN